MVSTGKILRTEGIHKLEFKGEKYLVIRSSDGNGGEGFGVFFSPQDKTMEDLLLPKLEEPLTKEERGLLSENSSLGLEAVKTDNGPKFNLLICSGPWGEEVPDYFLRKPLKEEHYHRCCEFFRQVYHKSRYCDN